MKKVVVFYLLLFSVRLFSAQMDPSLKVLLDSQSDFVSKTSLRKTNLLFVFGKGDVNEAESLGAHVQTHVGDFFTAVLPADRLSDFVRSQRVKRLAMGTRAHPLMDRARSFIDVDPVFQKGLTGSGVIVGVIDNSLDVTHPDFQSTNGLSRIAYFWDQTVTSEHSPEGYTYGVEYTKADLDAGRYTNMESDYHGTHVTGIAAGNGFASGGVYRGIAPESAIIFVKTGFYFSQVLDGIHYILDRSEQLGMPCVINLSLGVHDGSHTADDLFNQAVDALITEKGDAGHIIVWAAGNEGGWSLHATNRTQTNDSITFDISYSKRTLFVDLWYTNALDLPVEVRQSTNNILFALSTNDFSSSTLSLTHSIEGEQRRVRITFGSLFAANYQIVVGQTSEPVFIDAYLVNADVNNDSVVDNRFLNFTEEGTVSTFCAQTKSISVGAITTRLVYTNESGAETTNVGMQIGQVCDFSSMGPTRDGQYKPDFVAPGAFIISTKGHNASLDYAYGAYVINSNYMVEEGTSMSAPVVTGLIALLLQKEPNLTVDQVREKLKNGLISTVYKSNAGTWDSSYGYGIVNAGFLTATLPDHPSLIAKVVNNVIRLSGNCDHNAIFKIMMNNIGVEENIRVKIYSREGILIKDFGQRSFDSIEVVNYVWNGTDQFGRTVKPGFYQISVEGTTFGRRFYPILVVR